VGACSSADPNPELHSKQVVENAGSDAVSSKIHGGDEEREDKNLKGFVKIISFVLFVSFVVQKLKIEPSSKCRKQPELS